MIRKTSGILFSQMCVRHVLGRTPPRLQRTVTTGPLSLLSPTSHAGKPFVRTTGDVSTTEVAIIVYKRVGALLLAPRSCSTLLRACSMTEGSPSNNGSNAPFQSAAHSTNDKYSATPLATTRSGGTSPGGRTSMATPTALKVPVRINTPLTTNAQHYLVSVLHGPNN